MATFESAGVFNEEVESNVSPVATASTSAIGIVGFTAMGPTDDPQLCLSYPEFVKTFGDPIQVRREAPIGITPLSVAAFFANGGKRAWVKRVVSSDSTKSTSALPGIARVTTGYGDGTVATFTKLPGNTPLLVHGSNTPINPDFFSFSWRSAGVAVTAEQLKKRDGITNLAGVTGQTKFEGRIRPTGGTIPSFDYTGAYTATLAQHLVVVPGTATLKWTDGVGAKTLAIPAPANGEPIARLNAGDSALINTLAFDHATGILTVEFAVEPTNATAITMDFTPTTETKTAAATRDGHLTNATDLTAPGDLDLRDGSYTFTTVSGSKPHNHAPIIAGGLYDAVQLEAKSTGSWGEDLQIGLQANRDSYDMETGSFATFNLQIAYKGSIRETYDGLTIRDENDPQYAPNVLRDLSELITVPGDGPFQQGVFDSIKKVKVIAAGDQSVAGKTISVTLDREISPRTLRVAWTASADGMTKTASDDGDGHVSDTAGTIGTIGYTGRTLSLVLGGTVMVGSFVTVTYYEPGLSTGNESSGIGFGVSAGENSRFTEGTDGDFGDGHYGRDQISAIALSTQTPPGGIYALDSVDEILQVIVPEATGDVDITNDLLDYAENRALGPQGGDRFIILGTPGESQGGDATAKQSVDWVRFTLNRFSDYAAIYGPWVLITDPTSGRLIGLPPQGHVAGIYARTDATRNVGKAPAGTVDGQLRFCAGLTQVWTQAERDLVYPNRINPLIQSTRTGKAVWGARTLSNKAAWKYVNVRRLFMFVERSVYDSTFWAIFENNGPILWGQLKGQLEGFLRRLFNEGYFKGTSPSQAYFVTVDDSNNTADTIDAGQTIVDVGIAANKPSEFLRFKYTQLKS